VCDVSGANGCESAVLLGLRAIWLSHPHADHHLGLMRVLTERRRLAKAAGGGDSEPPPVLILAPAPVLAWLMDYRALNPKVRAVLSRPRWRRRVGLRVGIVKLSYDRHSNAVPRRGARGVFGCEEPTMTFGVLSQGDETDAFLKRLRMIRCSFSSPFRCSAWTLRTW
jgi:hypothetical protein